MSARLSRWMLCGAAAALALAGCGGGMNGFDTDTGTGDGGSDVNVSETGSTDGGGRDSGRADSGVRDGTSTDGGLDGNTQDGSAQEAGASDSGTADADGNGGSDASGSTDAGGTGNRCATATSITPGTTAGDLASPTGSLLDNSNGDTCRDGFGAYLAYVIDVPAGQQLSATVDPSTDLDPVVNLVAGPAGNCDASPLVCLASADHGGSGTPESAVYVNSSSSTQSVYVLVSSYEDAPTTTDFTLTTALRTPTTGGQTCATAVTVAPGTLAGETLSATVGPSVDSDSNGCQHSSGVSRVYAITVPSGKRLVASADASFDAVVNLVAGPASNCTASPLVCLSGSDSGNPESVSYLNNGAADQLVYIVVSAYSSSTTGGSFDLTVDIVSANAPGETCNTATPLDPGTLMGETFAGFYADYSVPDDLNNCANNTGPDRVYSITVPAGKRLTVNAASPDYLKVNLVAGPASNCGTAPLVCLAGASNYSAVSWLNQGTTDQDVFVIVAGYSNYEATATYDLTATLSTPSDDEVCGGATTVAATGTVTGQDLVGYFQDYNLDSANGCVGYGGPDRVYEVTVPAGEALDVTVTPGDTTFSGLNPVINFVPGPADQCTAMPVVCAASMDRTYEGDPETGRYFNATGSDQSVFVIVSSSSSDPTDSTFTLTTRTGPLPDGDLCDTATAIVTPGTLANEDLAMYGQDYSFSSANSSGCSYYSGSERAYAINVPAGKTLGVTVTPMNFDPVIELVAGPASNCSASPQMCLDSADLGGTGTAETATYANSGTTAQTVIIIVAAYSTSGVGTTYSLNTTITP